MNWITQYRTHILKHAHLLEQTSFSFLGEDDFSMKYTDGDVLISFSVERFSDSLDVLVEFLSDEQVDNHQYSLSMIIKVCSEQLSITTEMVESEQDDENMVKGYIEFIVNNKDRCFGKVFRFASEYRERSHMIGLELIKQFGE